MAAEELSLRESLGALCRHPRHSDLNVRLVSSAPGLVCSSPGLGWKVGSADWGPRFGNLEFSRVKYEPLRVVVMSYASFLNIVNRQEILVQEFGPDFLLAICVPLGKPLNFSEP